MKAISKTVIPAVVVPRALVYLIVFSILFLIAVALVSYFLDIPISRFTRDPMAVAGGHPFYGLLSNIGVILWSSSMALCFFSYFELKTGEGSSNTLGFVVWGGMLSLMLLVDDLFMLHERIYPEYFGVGEEQVFLVYGVLFVFYAVRYFKKIMSTEFVYLGCFALFLMGSLIVDRLPASFLPWHYLYEDGFKFLGIVCWVAYQSSVCHQEIRSRYSLTGS